jgi:hypothetical protein
MADYFQIFIRPKQGVSQEQIEKKINLAVDWFRCDKNLYVIYTTSEVDKWKARLIELVKPEGVLFICKLDITVRQGWMVKTFWEWLKKDR